MKIRDKVKMTIIKGKKEFKECSPQQIVVEGICFLIILSGIVTSIRMNLVGHSLWWDEAALAWSFSQRGLLDLTSEGLEKLQSAPVGWLYILKIFTLLFGNTDFVLRVPSILAYVGILILLYLILKRIFRVYYPMAGVAFVASLPIILQYSNIFKPYIADGFFCLLVIWFFHQYDSGKWKWWHLGIGWAVLVWFSNPTCFVAGGLLAATFLLHAWELIKNPASDKNRKGMLETVKICVPLGISFVLYYFYWLRQTATDGAMLNYWKDWNFPLIPRSMDDLRQIARMAATLFGQFYRLEFIICILLVAFVFYVLWKKNRILLGIYGSFAVALFASGLNMFPVNKRLWMFIYPLITILIFVGLDSFIDRTKKWHVSTFVIGTVMLCFSVLNAGIRYYWNVENVYWPRYELKMEYQHLKNVIEEDESVYVFVCQTPIFDYYNHYNMRTLEGTNRPVMQGTNEYLTPYDYKEDIRYITDAKKCYIVMGDTWDIDYFAGPLFAGLHEKGYMEMVYNKYETPMWYYCSDISDVKTKVEYEILSKERRKEETEVVVRVHNVGGSFLNPMYETLNLKVEAGDGEALYPLPKDIAPGEYADVTFCVKSGVTAKIGLESEYGKVCGDSQVTLE